MPISLPVFAETSGLPISSEQSVVSGPLAQTTLCSDIAFSGFDTHSFSSMVDISVYCKVLANILYVVDTRPKPIVMTFMAIGTVGLHSTRAVWMYSECASVVGSLINATSLTIRKNYNTIKTIHLEYLDNIRFKKKLLAITWQMDDSYHNLDECDSFYQLLWKFHAQPHFYRSMFQYLKRLRHRPN